MHLDEISPEVQLEIFRFCSPRDQYSLSTVHSSLRYVAERALYSHIYLNLESLDLVQERARSPRKLSLMHTLNASARKAAMVKSFQIEIYSWPRPQRPSRYTNWIRDRISDADVDTTLFRISESLKILPNLVVLSIFWDLRDDPSEKYLREAIRFVFNLNHLLY